MSDMLIYIKMILSDCFTKKYHKITRSIIK